jgi:hypothetical protein
MDTLKENWDLMREELRNVARFNDPIEPSPADVTF